MLKFVESSVTFTEFPTEVALCLNLSLCPNHCPNCSEAYLAGDIGEELTFELLNDLIARNPGITLVGFMGGDNDPETVYLFAEYIQKTYNLKVGMYSGRDFLDLNLASVLDYYKVGGWRMFKGAEETWKNQSAGPLCLPTSNQKMYKRVDHKLVDITDSFRKNPVNDWKRVLL